MSGIDLIARFLAAYKFTLPAEQVRDEVGLTFLSDLGVIEHRGSGATVLCHACDFPHSVKIGIDPITDKLGWRCSEAGFVEVEAEQLNAVRFSPDAFVTQIADALECQRRRASPLIENFLWNIGWYEFHSNDVNVYLVSRIRDADDMRAIAGALQAEPSLRNGIVIAPDVSGTSGLTIAGCRFASIGDVISNNSDGLSIDQSRVAAFAGIVKKRLGGRPRHSGADEATALIRERYQKEIYADGKRAEAREILSLLGDRSPKMTKLYCES